MGEEKQKTEDEELETENGKNRATHFLEINKIWFTTIIPLLVSMAVAAAGIASCWADIQQAKLTKMEIENINEEKQPFFSIEQEYNQERDQYIYTIYNTGGEVRYSDLQIMPILYVKQYGTDREIKNQAFKDLAGFYEYEITDDGLISFSDMWLDIAMLEEYSLGNNDSDKILGNDYLTGLFSRKNSNKRKEYITSELIYWVRVSYYNYRNEETYENIWLGRASDRSKRTSGNNILFLQPSLEERYYDGNNTKSEAVIDSLNLSGEETAKQCEEYAEELFEKWDF